MTAILVTGAGGFIGHHLVKYLVGQGHYVRAVSTHKPQWEPSAAHEYWQLDLRNPDAAQLAASNIEQVYMLAANMGGIDWIKTNKAAIMRDNTLIDLNTLEAARVLGVRRVFYASSACVYPGYLQNQTDLVALREHDAYPADPEDGYGWEKLHGERLCRHYREDYGLETRIARFHTMYGPLGAYEGGREKVPAALCRKIAECLPGGTIEVWGDGEQTRSYCYIDDCIEGIDRLMQSDYPEPVNLGSSEMVTVNTLVAIISDLAHKKVYVRHNLTKPQGVRGRNSDNTLCRKVLKWEPSIPLRVGLDMTYRWIHDQMTAQGRISQLEPVNSDRAFENWP